MYVHKFYWYKGYVAHNLTKNKIYNTLYYKFPTTNCFWQNVLADFYQMLVSVTFSASLFYI